MRSRAEAWGHSVPIGPEEKAPVGGLAGRAVPARLLSLPHCSLPLCTQLPSRIPSPRSAPSAEAEFYVDLREEGWEQGEGPACEEPEDSFHSAASSPQGGFDRL